MKLHEQLPARIHLVSRYSAGHVEIGGQQLTRPLIVAPALLHTVWIDTAGELTPESLAPLWPQEPRIVLLGGTGFAPGPLKLLRRALATRQAGLEIMDLGAACRTYNVLAQEERAVAALLFPA
ncbi:MAG TPA: Mth938-like domain-containing protein [Steroidobacteraceae bacterium]|nr:Mth938-like domain-containing protein [Steroidobacteraceae bacterium]